MKKKKLDKFKFNPDKEVSYRIVLDYWQDNTKEGLQLATACVSTFRINNRKREVEIDSWSLPTVVYKDLLVEMKEEFKRQEKVIDNRLKKRKKSL